MSLLTTVKSVLQTCILYLLASQLLTAWMAGGKTKPPILFLLIEALRFVTAEVMSLRCDKEKKIPVQRLMETGRMTKHDLIK